MNDKSDTALDELWELIYTSVRFPFLHAAQSLDLFTLLKGRPGCGLDEISAELKLQPRPGHVLLLGCTAFGLIRKRGDGYHNTAATELLAGDPDAFMPVIVRYTHDVLYQPMGWLLDSLVNDKNEGLYRELLADTPASTLYELLGEDANLEQIFTAMMEHQSKSVVEDLVDAVDFSRYEKVLDVGGGTGTNSIGFVKRWPQLRATLLELPNVAELAAERIADAGLSDRIDAVGTDIWNEDFPTSHDCVVYSRFLEIWSPEQVRDLFAKTYRALEPGGHMVIVACAQHDDETGPFHAAFMAGYVQTIASPEGRIYTASEFEQWYSEAGFESIDRQYPGRFDVILRARKPLAA